MAGTDDMMGEWAPPIPCPRTLVSSFLNDDFCLKSFPDFMAKNGNEGPPQPKMEEGESSFNFSNNLIPEVNPVGSHKAASSSHGGGLAGRMAANGFNLPKIDTARIAQSTMVSPSSDVLTIPPGLSPTSLLESPVFLSNSMVQPSPTTGKLLLAQNSSGNHNTMPIREAPKTEDELFEDAPEAFAFKPPLDPNSSFLLHSERRVGPSFDQQYSFPNIKVSVQSGNPIQTGSLEADCVDLQNKQESNIQGDRKDTSDNVLVNQRVSDSFMGSDHSPPPDDQQDCEADQKEFSSAAVGTPAEDGYNWRKYGQKQVKGSEYPRSYYKCTHPNCQVKKKVERSHEGHITEIIYKGAHNHPKPPPSRRSGVLPSHPFNDQQIDGTEQPAFQASFDGKPIWASTQNNAGQDWRSDGMEATSPSLVTGELCEPSTTTVQQPQDGTRLSSDAIDVSSTMSNDEEEDRATHGSVSVGCDGEGDETESKRRKLEACAIEMSAASRAVREPRVVVQTTSEVDILDDGYRWRKYGQKVVKGNPNPRSYYKCTNPGCTVRKHVERASHDLKSVITTYEGKHNHDVPAARNSTQNSATSNASVTSAPQAHSLMRRTDPIQDGLVRFESHAPLGAYSLAGREQLGPPSGFSFAMGQMGQQNLTNLAMAGIGPMAPMKMPVLPPVHAYMGVPRQHHEGGFMVPKGEPKEEPMPGSEPPLPNGGSVYHQMMSRMPLGPQL